MVHTLVLVEVPNCVNVHEAVVKLPPAPPSLQDTVPVGILFVPRLESRIFASKFMPVPIVAVAGFGVTVVLVARIVTASADVPDPPAFVVSPEYVAVIQIWPDFDGVYDI